MIACKLTGGRLEFIDNGDKINMQTEILNVIEEHLGKEFRNIVGDAFEEIKIDKEKVLREDVVREWEEIADSHFCALNDLLEMSIKALQYLDKAKRINRDKIYEYFDDIYTRINQEI